MVPGAIASTNRGGKVRYLFQVELDLEEPLTTKETKELQERIHDTLGDVLQSNSIMVASTEFKGWTR